MPLSPQDYGYIREVVLKASGIVLEAGKEYLIDNRISPLLRAEGLTNPADLVARMRTGSTALVLTRKVIEAMTTNETSFFRDVHPFDTLKDKIIPDLIKARQATRRINIWCAAASSGQEPYTIALILREFFPQLLAPPWQVSFLATDLSAEMISRCREGRYSQLEVNRGLPIRLLLKHFVKQGMEWQASEALRNTINFREMNLCEEWGGMPVFDIVFMRNVLIYFSIDTKKQIFARLRRNLARDGMLFLGGAETTLNIDDAFDRVATNKGGVYQIKAAA
jgi:chemotaxis protein methyltransferase CheR